jgi:hypothetical protein
MMKYFDLQQQTFFKNHPNGCPYENHLCNHRTMQFCDPCIDKLMKTEVIPVAVAVSGGSACKAPDVQPTQDFKASSSGPICEGCQQPEGSNLICKVCAFFEESAKTARNGDQNPNVPVSIQFQDGVGPRQEDLCALTPEAVQASVDFLRSVLASMSLPLIPIMSCIMDFHVGQWRGCEWSSGNCWLVAILQMFQTGSWHTSINVSNPLGNALWILIHELRTRGFVPRQMLQAFRRLMQEIIGQREKGTLFENGQMDPFEVLRMLEDAGAFIYNYKVSWIGYIEEIHATPVINLAISPSTSRNLIERLDKLNPEINLSENNPFSGFPTTFVFKVSVSERSSGSIVDFPTKSGVFDIDSLTLQPMSVLLFIDGHYLTVFIRLVYKTQTDTISKTYWLSDSKSKKQDCGHHVPSILEIDQAQFDDLWENHAVSLTCERVKRIGDIDGILNEWTGITYEPLRPGYDSLPMCMEGQYATFEANGEIRIFQVAPPPPPASCAQSGWFPPQQTPCAQVAWALFPPSPPASCVQTYQMFEFDRWKLVPDLFSLNGSGKWIFDIYATSKSKFEANGTFYNKDTYSSRTYVWKGREYCITTIHTALKDAYELFLKTNPK